MTNEQIASKILSDAKYEGELNDEVSHEQLHEAIVAALEAARRSVTDAARGGIIDCTGDVPCVRRVLGTLVLTEDGAVACEEGDCWCIVRATEDDPWSVRKCRRSGNPEDYGCWWQVDEWSDFGGCIFGKVYSTESAARAAMEGGPR